MTESKASHDASHTTDAKTDTALSSEFQAMLKSFDESQRAMYDDIRDDDAKRLALEIALEEREYGVGSPACIGCTFGLVIFFFFPAIH
jgi:hypothetical protein